MGYLRRILCFGFLFVTFGAVDCMQQVQHKQKPLARHAAIKYEKETGMRVLAFYDQEWRQIYSEPYEGTIEICRDLSPQDQERLTAMMNFKLSSIEDWT